MNTRKILVMFLLFIMSLPIIGVEEKINGKIIITTQEWKPYNYKKENGKVGGIATEIIEKVLDEMKVEYQITIYPWARAQMMVKNGDADAFYAASVNSERDSYATMSNVVIPQNWYWYLDKESKLDPTKPDFKEKANVAALFGSNMLKYLEDNKYKIIGTPNNMDKLVKIIDSKRVDAVLVNDLVIIEYFKSNQINADNYKKVLCQKNPLGIYFSKEFLDENPWFLDKFNSILKKYVISEQK